MAVIVTTLLTFTVIIAEFLTLIFNVSHIKVAMYEVWVDSVNYNVSKPRLRVRAADKSISLVIATIRWACRDTIDFLLAI